MIDHEITNNKYLYCTQFIFFSPSLIVFKPTIFTLAKPGLGFLPGSFNRVKQKKQLNIAKRLLEICITESKTSNI